MNEELLIQFFRYNALPSHIGPGAHLLKYPSLPNIFIYVSDVGDVSCSISDKGDGYGAKAENAENAENAYKADTADNAAF